jgi:hypothetical protein
MFCEEDLTDDSTGMIPMLGTKTPAGLQVRLMQRLSRMAAADVKMHEAGQAVEIYLTRNPGSPQLRIERDTELQQLLQGIETSLTVISNWRTSTWLLMKKLPS